MDRRLTQLTAVVARGWQRTGVDADVLVWAEERVAEADEIINRLQRPDGYHDHLLSYVQQEADRYPDGRDRPVCDCRNADCDLKHGRLPRRVRQADRLDTGIRRLKQSHPGYPRVLDEARAEWNRDRARAQRALRQAVIAVKNDVIPTEVETPAVPSGSREDAESAAANPG